METFDVIVIGGGLMGCFSARGLARYHLKTALLEAREDLCTGISRANTAIVYSGIDTKPGTLKSIMCVRAVQSFDTLCADLGVRYSPCGSVMICFGPKGEETLRKKLAQGRQNGVHGLKLLSGSEVLALEPNISGNVRLGLYAPQAGTVIPWELGLAAAENAVKNGVSLYLNTKVNEISHYKSGYKVSAGGKTFYTRGIINCAGLYADEILEKAQRPSVRLSAKAGDYFVLDTKTAGFIGHVIFHEPEEKGKGLTLVPTVDGNILVGPTRRPADKKNGFKTSQDDLNQLRTLVGDVIPGLPMEHIIRSFSSLRPNPFYVCYDPESGGYVREERSISSFVVHESEESPAFLSLIGIKTPGITCSDELGRHVSDRMALLLDAGENPAFDPVRPAPLRLTELSFDERTRLIEKKPAYGRIVCRCRGISEGEIVDSIRAYPGAVTVDGVKRRTGANSGRCQGGYCTQRIIEILSRELNVNPADISKDGPGSYMIGGETHDAV